jgi:hypothetical protein
MIRVYRSKGFPLGWLLLLLPLFFVLGIPLLLVAGLLSTVGILLWGSRRSLKASQNNPEIRPARESKDGDVIEVSDFRKIE